MPDLRARVSRRDTRRGDARSEAIHGFLADLPRIGAPLVCFAQSAGGRVASVTTSPVDRILIAPDGALFIQTRQSVYRVILDAPVIELPAPERARATVDGFDASD